MREIEFRKFDKVLKTMQGCTNCLTDMFTVRSDGQISGNSNCILMQYTGLKDKNGVKIFEGDIIELHHPPITILKKVKDKVREVTENRISCPAEIWFEDGTFVYGWREIALTPIGIEADRLIKNKRVNNIHIIGNIYENPELLELK